MSALQDGHFMFFMLLMYTTTVAVYFKENSMHFSGAALAGILIDAASEFDNAVRVSRTTKCNVPAAALKWSVERPEVEFGMTSNTLRKSLAKNSAAPDADGLFTTRQITDPGLWGFERRKARDSEPVEAQVSARKSDHRGVCLEQGSAHGWVCSVG
jgi:hypothetical protein